MAKRLSQDDLLNFVHAQIAASGGQVSHNALNDALEADGAAGAIVNVVKLAMPGARSSIRAEVIPHADGTMQVIYLLRQPSAPAAPVSAPSTPAAPVSAPSASKVSN